MLAPYLDRPTLDDRTRKQLYSRGYHKCRNNGGDKEAARIQGMLLVNRFIELKS